VGGWGAEPMLPLSPLALGMVWSTGREPGQQQECRARRAERRQLLQRSYKYH